MSDQLTKSQLLALEHTASYAASLKVNACRSIQDILYMSNISTEEYELAIGKLKQHAKVALHFHPDRLDPAKKSVAEALLEQGIYKSQFETLLSNGSVSAFPGGDRDNWEKRLFGGAYQVDGTMNSERPKYGALHIMPHADGPAPRFGSCYFLLSPQVSRRCTFTYMDSHQDPKEKGTYEQFNSILAAILEESFLRDYAIGERDLSPRRFIEHLKNNMEQPLENIVQNPPNRNLNHYIEAQIHGDVSLEHDVIALVADPSFKGTPTGQTLEQICEKYEIDLHWHKGFKLSVHDVPADFRGPNMPSLAAHIATTGQIDARTIGAAAVHVVNHPEEWKSRGDLKTMLQELKMLWHVFVRCGKPYLN